MNNIKFCNKEFIVLKPKIGNKRVSDWLLVYNPTGVESLRGVGRYLAYWLIRFVPIVKSSMTAYQWLKLIENELYSYFAVNQKEVCKCLTMEIIHSKVAKGHVNIIFSIPGDAYVTETCKGIRKSPIILYSPIPMKFKIDDTTGFPDFINPIEKMYDCLQEAGKSSEDFKITV